MEYGEVGQGRRGSRAAWLVRPLMLALLMALVATGCRQDPVIEPSGRTVKVGVIGPFSGPDAFVGKSGLEGVEVALSHHPLLANGDRVELLVEDDLGQPEETVEALERLDDKGVAAVILLSRSNSALFLADRRHWKKIPVVATTASHPALTETSPHFVQLTFDDAFQSAVAALFLRDELLLERAAVISDPDDEHSRFLAENFVERFGEANGVVVQHLVLPDKTMDLREPLANLQREDVQVLYVPTRAGLLLHVAGSLREMGWQPVIMTSDGLLSEIMLKHQDKLGLIDGIMATDMHSSLLLKTTYGEDISGLFLEQEREYGSTFTILGSEGASILVQALDRCRPPYEPQDVQRQLRMTRSFEGFSGPLSIGRDGKAIRPVYVNTMRGQKLEFMVKVY